MIGLDLASILPTRAAGAEEGWHWGERLVTGAVGGRRGRGHMLLVAAADASAGGGGGSRSIC